MARNQGAFGDLDDIGRSVPGHKKVMISRGKESASVHHAIAGGGLLHLNFAILVEAIGKARVSTSGMCCTMTIPGQSGGIAIRNSLSASVPPVDAPTAMILWPAGRCFGSGFLGERNPELLRGRPPRGRTSFQNSERTPAIWIQDRRLG